ncbi:hypothetical protein [Acidithiobacillus thiooxidans]|uniref:hypothetical protein n=1 Tax=Acidithiobacillus thiooxidans TaxID=930 RepID=UPI003564E844
MNFDCPYCHSGQTQKLSVAYASGLSKIDAWVSGAAIGSGGYDIAGGKVTGNLQSVLSQNAAPPAKAGIFGPVLMITATFFILDLMVSWPSLANDVLNILWIPACIAWILWALRHNRKVWPRQYKDWDSYFICLRCGMRFCPR